MLLLVGWGMAEARAPARRRGTARAPAHRRGTARAAGTMRCCAPSAAAPASMLPRSYPAPGRYSDVQSEQQKFQNTYIIQMYINLLISWIYIKLHIIVVNAVFQACAIMLLRLMLKFHINSKTTLVMYTHIIYQCSMVWI